LKAAILELLCSIARLKYVIISVLEKITHAMGSLVAYTNTYYKLESCNLGTFIFRSEIEICHGKWVRIAFSFSALLYTGQ